MLEFDEFREVVRNGNLDGFIAVTVIVVVFRTPHDVPLITGFVGLQLEEAILTKTFKKSLCNIPLIQSEERNYIVWLQQFMYRGINDTYIYIYDSNRYMGKYTALINKPRIIKM